MAENTVTYQPNQPTREELEQLRVTVEQQMTELLERKPYLSPDYRPSLCIPSYYQGRKDTKAS